ncbi:MAG TPA: DinB family protein [Gemmatimonadaceae bacterium]|nr:DinB family protein [Gemmatimonadaceae bacterium]
MQDLIDDLNATLRRESARLLAISDDAAARRPAEDKWSAKEIIGHLIDSATNNHGRFVRAALSDEMVFPGYDQESWVRVQRHNERSWPDLVRLWELLNHNIAALVGCMSPDSLSRLRGTHNLDQIAWRTLPRTDPVTLEYFVRDYVAHMQHHLGQIE